MYIILVKYKNYKLERNLLANDYNELKEVIRLAPTIKYEVISVKKYSYELAKDFIKRAKEKIKPKRLVYGTDVKGEPIIFREDCQEKED